MTTYVCEYSKYDKQKDCLTCHLIKDDFPYCGHQYFCRLTNKWENTQQAKECQIKPNRKE